MKIFITGISGQLGRILAKVLSVDHEIVGLIRKPVSIPEASELVEGDLLYPEGFVDKLANCDCVIFNAAVYRDSGVETDLYFKVNAHSIESIFALLAKNKACKLKKAVYISTNAVHDLSGDGPVNEESPFGPSDYYQYSKYLGEQIFLKWAQALGIQGNIVRPGMIWGDGDERLKKIFLLAKFDPIPIIGWKNPWCHFITFSDLARCIKKIVEDNHINLEAFLIAGKRAVRLLNLFEIISFILGKIPRFIKLPLSLFDLASDLLEPPFRLFRKNPPIFRRRFAFFTKNRIFNCSKFYKLFGKTYSKDLISEVSELCYQYGLIKDQIPRHEIFVDFRNLDQLSRFKLFGNQVALDYTSYEYSEEFSKEFLILSPVRKIIEARKK